MRPQTETDNKPKENVSKSIENYFEKLINVYQTSELDQIEIIN